MNRRRAVLLFLAAAAALSAGAACHRSTSSAHRPDLSPAEHFKVHQAPTMTPHGKILMDSVTENDGRIYYTTEDGRRWRVAYAKRPDGTYRYETPDEVR